MKTIKRTLQDWARDYTQAVEACRVCLTDNASDVLVDMHSFDYWAKRVSELKDEFREWGRA